MRVALSFAGEDEHFAAGGGVVTDARAKFPVLKDRRLSYAR
jgi:hypothetical protein